MTNTAKASPLGCLARYRRVGDNEQALIDALERARVVGVLDAFAECTGIEPAVYRSQTPGLWCCDCDGFSNHDGNKVFRGPTRDDARAAAAKAIENGEV